MVLRQLQPLDVNKKIPRRVIIGLMIFLSGCVNYMMRVNLSVNLVAMVPLTNNTNTSSQVTFKWTTFERAQVLGSYFWGYLAGSIISALSSDYFSSKTMLTSITFFNSLITFLSPPAAKISYIWLIVLRVILGVLNGFLFPSLAILISNWAVDKEKSRFACIPVVSTSGTFFCWIACGPIIEKYGWEWGFYVFGIIGLITSILIYFLVYDSPNQYPGISSDERNYIKAGITNKKTSKRIPPYKDILTSIPCWSYFILEFGLGWCVFFIITTAPHYLSTALNYDTSTTSILSGLVYLARCSAALVFGHVGDYIIKKKLMTINLMRKSTPVLSHLIPGCLIACLSIEGFGSGFHVALIILAMIFNGSVVISCLVNVFDLTMNFVGTLSSISTVMCTMAGIIVPFVTAYFVEEDETNPELWRPVFYIGAAIYILCGAQFIIFGSTKIEPWDKIEEVDKQQVETAS